MIHVVGHWELSWNAPISEAPLWNLPLRDFGVEFWWMWPVSGVRNSERTVALHERASLDAILEELPDIPRVYVEPENPHFDVKAEDLHTFEHPDDCAYIFGSAHFNAAHARGREEDAIVRLRTLEDSGVLWPHQVLVTLLHDRLVKSWQ